MNYRKVSIDKQKSVINWEENHVKIVYLVEFHFVI